jgi:hypothetical protein
MRELAFDPQGIVLEPFSNSALKSGKTPRAAAVPVLAAMGNPDVTTLAVSINPP